MGYYGSRDNFIALNYEVPPMLGEPPSVGSSAILMKTDNYRDLDGGSGEMKVLATAKKVIENSATADEEVSLRRYCESDVRNMYRIVRSCEQLIFTRRELRRRRRLYSVRGRRSLLV